MPRKHDKTELPKLAKLSAFFSQPVSTADLTVSHYPLDQLAPNSDQPRKYFDQAELQQLADSIRHCGVLEPLLVTKEQNSQRTILAGERRWRAAQLAGLTSLPVYELDLDPEIAAQVPLIENLLRRDLNPFEELEGYLLLLAQQLIGQPEFAEYCSNGDFTEGAVRLLFAMRNAQSGRRAGVDPILVDTVTALFRAIGATSWQSFVAHRLALRKLPNELQQAMREGWLDYTKAKEVAKLTPERLGSPELARQARQKLLAALRQEQLPVREVRARVAALLNSVSEEAPTQQLWQRSRQLLRRLNQSAPKLDQRRRERAETLLNQLEKLLGEQ